MSEEKTSGIPVFYFGAYLQAGHHFWKPGMRSWRNGEREQPWGYRIDTELLTEAQGLRLHKCSQTEGEAVLAHEKDWSVLSFWDRSVDTRMNSNSAFLAHATCDFEEMVVLAQKHFPQVWSRFSFTIRLREIIS